MKKVLAVLLAVTMLLGAVAAFSSCKKKTEFTVGICQFVQHDALDAATKGFSDVLKEKLGDRVEIITDVADATKDTCITIVNKFVSKKVDLILANATPALQVAADKTTTIPVLGTSVTDYAEAFEIKDFNGTVGGNVSGTSDLAPLKEQAAMIKDLFPDAKTVSIMFTNSEANSLYQVRVVKEELIKLGFKEDDIDECGFSDSNDVAVAAKKAAQSDVIYIPTDNTCASCAGTIEANIGDTPVVAGEEGICSTTGTVTYTIDYYDLGRTTGEMAVKILLGEANISEMPIQRANAFYKFNEAKCKQVGLNIDQLIAKGYVAIK